MNCTHRKTSVYIRRRLRTHVVRFQRIMSTHHHARTHPHRVHCKRYNSLFELLPAVLAAWRPGEEGGTAVWNILTGVTNPSGRSVCLVLLFVAKVACCVSGLIALDHHPLVPLFPTLKLKDYRERVQHTPPGFGELTMHSGITHTSRGLGKLTMHPHALPPHTP
jgi:hypothetical protein